jgi:hypothetical protein
MAKSPQPASTTTSTTGPALAGETISADGGATGSAKTAQASPPSEANPTENFRSGYLLSPGDSFDVHPTARRFRRTKAHRKKLEQSLTEHGQRTDAVLRILPDGRLELLDGLTRCQILHGRNQPLACRILTESELCGKPVEQWIVAAGFAGDEGRQMNDTQRAIQVVELEDELSEAIRNARERSRAGTKADEAEKGTAAHELAKLANVKESRVQKLLDMKRANPEVATALLDAIWDGRVSLFQAVNVAKLSDAQTRGDALAAAKAGDKKGLARILGAAPPRDALRVTIPKDLAGRFAQKAHIDRAVKQLKKSADTLREAGVEAKHVEAIEEVVRRLQLDSPYAMCDACNFTGRGDGGDKCGTCQGKRWLTVREFEVAKEKQRAKLVQVR